VLKFVDPCAVRRVSRRRLSSGVRAVVAIGVLAALAGCASLPADTGGGTKAQPIAPTAEPPPPGINLSGFPLAYRQGYADGCGSATGPERKDASRFAAEPNYRTGWQDGLALCRKR
jgi:hypothetical protein